MKIAFQEMSKENEKTQMSIRREITSHTYTENDDTKASKFPIPLGGIAYEMPFGLLIVGCIQ